MKSADEILKCNNDKIFDILNTTKFEGLNIPIANVLGAGKIKNAYEYMRIFRNKGINILEVYMNKLIERRFCILSYMVNFI